MNVKLAVFDLDGTLLYTLDDLGTAANHSLSEGGFPTHPLPAFKMMVGQGVRNLMRNALPKGTPEDILSERLKSFTDYYAAHIDGLTVPYPGITEMLETLQAQGVKLAVASNKFQQGTSILVEKFFPQIEWLGVYGNSADIPLKPDPAVLELLMKKADVLPHQTVMVGDAGTDIQTARNAGAHALAVNWGYRPLEDLKNADAMAGTSEELLNLISTL